MVDKLDDNYQINERAHHILKEGIFADCHFLVGKPPNQKLISGHKVILAMTSPVFQQMFYGPLAEKVDTIVVTDVTVVAFSSMLEQMYSDDFEIASFEMACELCYAAKKYMMPFTVDKCIKYLSDHINPKNACATYEFAKLFDETCLMEKSMNVIIKKTQAVLADPSFADIEIFTLMAILDQDELNIDYELDLFNVLQQIANEWGFFSNKSDKNANDQNNNENLTVKEVELKTESSEAKTESSEAKTESSEAKTESSEVKTESSEVKTESSELKTKSSELKTESTEVQTESIEEKTQLNEVNAESSDEPAAATAINLNYFTDTQRLVIDEAMIRQAVKKIRFLTMTPQQFSEGPACSKLLKQDEAFAILIKISRLSDNDFKMPEGFCNSRSDRSKRGLSLRNSYNNLLSQKLTRSSLNTCNACEYSTNTYYNSGISCYTKSSLINRNKTFVFVHLDKTHVRYN